MTLHQTCAFEVIKVPNARVIVLVYPLFLTILHIVEIGDKAHKSG